MKSCSAIRALCLVLICSHVLSGLAAAAEFHVSPNGKDSSPGTLVNPWRTLKKANKTLRPGDTVILEDGSYDDPIRPDATGTTTKPIVYRSRNPHQAVLTASDWAIDLSKRQHTIVDGFLVKPKRGGFAKISNATGIHILNCRMEGSSGRWSGLSISRSKQIRLIGNTIEKHRRWYKDLYFGGDLVNITESSDIVVENNVLGKGGHGTLQVRVVERAVIRGNVIYSSWGRSASLFHSTRLLFEHNVITGAIDGSGSAGSGGKIKLTDGIFRNNLVTRNWGEVLSTYPYVPKTRIVSETIARNSRHYHNTLAYNLGKAWGLGSSKKVDKNNISGNIWKNNIFYMNDYAGSFHTIGIGRVGPNNLFENNCICGDKPGRRVTSLGTVAKSDTTAYFRNNLDVAPGFEDPESNDFRLRAGSACIDRGSHLAQARGSGSGKILPVDDARWFFDGFGVSGQEGDLVFVGPTKLQARVISANLADNTLALDRAVSWNDGDGVSRPYRGAHPDVGAMEHGAESQAWYVRLTVPEGLIWSPPADPRSPLFESDWEDANREKWGFLWNLNRVRQTDHARDRCQSGRCLKVFATGKRSVLGVSIKPWLWDIRKYPFVEFDYRIPAAVPIGVAMTGFVGKDVLAASSPANSKSGKHRLTADNAWHTIRFDVRELYPRSIRYLRGVEFRTKKTGRADAAYWIDNFRILPDPSIKKNSAFSYR